MKKSIITMLALAMCATVGAQNEHMYIFRNNRSFDFFRLSDISEITYSGTGGKYSTMAVKTATEEKRITMQQIDSCVVRSTAIPDIYVNLTEYPDIDQLFDGNGFNKSTIYAARLRMDGNGMYDDLPEQEVEFRGRGNSTWSFKKKPYRFKMKKKASVCDLPKAKTFALIANYIDPSHMRNAVALWVARELGLPYTNHTVPVNVYLNGFYRGAYFMTEKIGIGSGSVDIDENTGMLFELDNALDEDYTFIYTFANDRSKSLPVMVKDPDLDEIKPNPVERTAYLNDWQSDFARMANAITSPRASVWPTISTLRKRPATCLSTPCRATASCNTPRACISTKKRSVPAMSTISARCGISTGPSDSTATITATIRGCLLRPTLNMPARRFCKPWPEIRNSARCSSACGTIFMPTSIPACSISSKIIHARLSRRPGATVCSGPTTT